MGSAAMDSFGAVDGHLGTRAGRILPAGTKSVARAVEPHGAVVGDARATHLLFSEVGGGSLPERAAPGYVRRITRVLE